MASHSYVTTLWSVTLLIVLMYCLIFHRGGLTNDSTNVKLFYKPDVERFYKPDQLTQINATAHYLSNATHKPEVRVLILAAMRSGSSFLGEIFGQREDFFYMFEPCHWLDFLSTSETLKRHLTSPMCAEICEKVLQCEFSQMRSYLERLIALARNNGSARLAEELSTLISRTCQWTGPRGNRVTCGNITPPKLTRICDSRLHVALKTIRVFDVSQLKTLIFRDPRVRVIHLARDPRGVLSSQMKYYEFENESTKFNDRESFLYKFMERYCGRWVSNREIGENFAWMSGRYFLIRYEDLARFPIQYTSEMYAFVGLDADIPGSVRRWIEQNTKSASTKFFGTKRNSNKTYERWRRSLPLKSVLVLQNIPACKEMMATFGYKLVLDNDELLDLNKTLVEPTPNLNSSRDD